jgi:hypothetical protein
MAGAQFLQFIYLLLIKFDKSRFHVPYMHGCPVPGDNVSQKLKHIFASKNQPGQPRSFASPGGFNADEGGSDGQRSGRKTSATNTDGDDGNGKKGRTQKETRDKWGSPFPSGLGGSNGAIVIVDDWLESADLEVTVQRAVQVVA